MATLPRTLLLLTALALLMTIAIGTRDDAEAQNPTPLAFMRNVNPGSPKPDDGASVLIVQGQFAGLCGKNFPLDLLEYITIKAINSGRRVVTALSLKAMQTRARPAPEFWDTAPGHVAAYTEINQSLHNLINRLAPNGITWWYTQNFSQFETPVELFDWNTADYYNITYTSISAPQIATEYMVGMANHLTNVDPNREIAVTWGSPAAAYVLGENVAATSRINGPPYSEWGYNLSIRFINGTAEQPCDDWDFDGLYNGTGDDCRDSYNPYRRGASRQLAVSPERRPQ